MMDRTLGGLLAALTLAGCASTYEARGAEPSGFLSDYDQLKPGTGDEAQLVYIDPEADFPRYTKMMIDPVTIWYSDRLAISKVPREELHALASYLDRALRNQLGHDYQFVDVAGPDTMRLRVAITEAKGSRVMMDTITTVIPGMFLISEVDKLTTGTYSFVGKAGIEGELLDSVTHERLGAAVDRRAGGKNLKGATSSWRDVESAFDYWAARLRKRLEMERDKPVTSGG